MPEPSSQDARVSTGGSRLLFLLIARREVSEYLRSRSTVLTAVLFVLGFPLLFLLITGRMGDGPPSDALGYVFNIYLLQMSLMPATIVVMTSATAFVGEIETGSILPLVASPARDGDIYWGKVLANAVPAVILGYLAPAIFAVSASVFLGGFAFDPILIWILLCLVPVFYTLALALSLLVSAYAKEIRSAQQYSSFALIPLLFAMMFGGAKLLEPGRHAQFFALIGLLFVIDVVVLRIGARLWKRERIVLRV